MMMMIKSKSGPYYSHPNMRDNRMVIGLIGSGPVDRLPFRDGPILSITEEDPERSPQKPLIIAVIER